MKVVDFAEKLRDLINEKIDECRNGIHESHNHMDKDRLLIEIHQLPAGAKPPLDQVAQLISLQTHGITEEQIPTRTYAKTCQRFCSNLDNRISVCSSCQY
jgi:hypothetical protein